MVFSESAQKIIDVLTPILGKGVAKASVEIHCKKNGTTLENLSLKDLPAILRGVELGLACFLGRDRATVIGQQLRDLFPKA